MAFLKNSQNFLMQSLALYTSHLFSTLLNEDFVDIRILMEYVHLLFLQMNFQDYFYIHGSFLLYVKDLHN